MEITSDQWAALVDNEDGTSTMQFRIKFGDEYVEHTMVLDQPLSEFMMALAPTVTEEAAEVMHEHATHIPQEVGD